MVYHFTYTPMACSKCMTRNPLGIGLANFYTHHQDVCKNLFKDMTLFLSAKLDGEFKSEVSLSLKSLIEMVWPLLCFMGRKNELPFFQKISTSLILLHAFQKRKHLVLTPPFPKLSLFLVVMHLYLSG